MSNLLTRVFRPESAKRQGAAFVVAVLLAYAALQIPFSVLIGTAETKFTLFDFVAPTFAALWGMTVGLGAVLFVNLANIFITGNFTLAAFARLLPVLFGAYYFARRDRASGWVGLVAMAAFIAHPIGREVWYYSLYWLIPFAMQRFGRGNLFASALGATFTQHAVGGVTWLYAFGLSAEIWRGLIPIVAAERLLFATGIAVSYVAFQALARWEALKLDRIGFRKAVSLVKIHRQ
jgi:hypothetical protein